MTTTTTTTTTTTAATSSIPRGIYISSLHMFQIMHNKGKTFSNGGFGIALPKEEHAQLCSTTTTNSANSSTNSNTTDTTDTTNTNTTNTTTNAPLNLYVWVEEALYLHDAGLADFVSSASSSSPSPSAHRKSNTNDTKEGQQQQQQQQHILSTKQLFAILLSTTPKQKVAISLPVYRVYAYLRLQSYRVLRYMPNDTNHGTPSSTSTRVWKQKQQQQHHRSQAPPPQVWRQDDDDDTTTATTINPATKLAWQVYAPNAQFRKTNPGPPSFYVTICHYATPSPPVTDLWHLLESSPSSLSSPSPSPSSLFKKEHQQKQHQQQSNSDSNRSTTVSIPIKVAAVADSGTVILFGLTNHGVPSIASPAVSQPARQHEGDNHIDENGME